MVTCDWFSRLIDFTLLGTAGLANSAQNDLALHPFKNRPDGTRIFRGQVRACLNAKVDQLANACGLPVGVVESIQQVVRESSLADATTFVCKYVSTKTAGMLGMKGGGLNRKATRQLAERTWRERQYCELIYPQFDGTPGRVPQIYGSRFEAVTDPANAGRFSQPACSSLIVMQDLAENEFTKYKLFQHIPFEEMQPIIDGLADVHAIIRKQGEDQASQFPEVLYGPFGCGKYRQRIDSSYAACRRRLQQIKDPGENLKRSLADSETSKMLAALQDLSLNQMLDDHAHLFQFKTLVHGDVHGDNIFVQRETGQLCLIDWQVCGVNNPASELAYLLNYSTNPSPQRDQHFLETYHKAWCESMNRYSPECKTDYSLADLKVGFQVCTALLLKMTIVHSNPRRANRIHKILLDRMLFRMLERTKEFSRDSGFLSN